MRNNSLCRYLLLLAISFSAQHSTVRSQLAAPSQGITIPPRTLDCSSDLTDAIDCPADATTSTLQIDTVVRLRRSASVCILFNSVGEPVARSYDGHAWEAYFNTAVPNAVQIGCDCSTCLIQVLQPGEYQLMAQAHSLSPIDEAARFLEQATFGPRPSDLQAFTSPEEWILEQMEVPMTSHRAIYRQHWNHRFPHSSYQGVVTHPCAYGTRYRQAAFSDKDWKKYVTIRTLSDSRKELSIEGHVRTVIEARKLHVRPPEEGFELKDGDYAICQRLRAVVGSELHLLHTDSGNCFHLYTDGVAKGVPEVHLPGTESQSQTIITLPEQLVQPIDSQYYNGTFQELFVAAALNDPVCTTLPNVTGAPEQSVFGLYQGKYYLHDPRYVVLDNTFETPNTDGSAVRWTEGAADEVYRARCSNAPITFINEAYCVVAQESACLSSEFDTRVSVDLSVETFTAAYPERYVYAITGLRQDPVVVPTPCSPGAISRWIPAEIATCESTWVTPQTQEAIARLIRRSTDENALLRDVLFPQLSEPFNCDATDAQEYDFSVLVDGTCWQNVHPLEWQIFDFTNWVENHPGGPSAIQQFALDGTYILKFPDWHEMDRFYTTAESQGIVRLGRLGDAVILADSPAAADAFASVTSTTRVGSTLSCGSPFEVANEPSLGGSMYQGGFDGATEYNATTVEEDLEHQRTSIWMNVALTAPDQLRQKTAWALSQITSVAPTAIEAWFSSENFLIFYDIFVRHAFGNYRDILKEVAYSPLMAEMLTFLNSQGTNFIWEDKQVLEYPDENFAREVLQLFSIGVYMLNMDGTWVLDENGQPLSSYTNADIVEYSRMWTGFQQQVLRGNVEVWSKWKGSLVDPMMINIRARDNLPKMGLHGSYVGDAYPLCKHLPAQHFLKMGATYRLLGSTPIPRLLAEQETWYNSTTIKRVKLEPESALFAKLCQLSDDGSCQYQAVVELDENLACTGVECETESLRIIEVTEGMFYEYTRLPCVEQAFYSDPSMMRLNWHVFFCGDPEVSSGSVACCDGDNDGATMEFNLFDGERTTYAAAEKRCSDNGKNLCRLPWWTCDDCDVKLGVWTNMDCTLQVKIGLDGKVGVVHHVDVDEVKLEDIHNNVRQETKTSFRVDWEGPIAEFLASYEAECTAHGCGRDTFDNLCLCPVSVNETQAFTTPPTKDEVLEQLTIGSFSPDILDETYQKDDLGNGVYMYSTDGQISARSIFQVKDALNIVHLRMNLKSTVTVGSQNALSFRNPPHFMSLVYPELRDAIYETDAGIDHYVQHPNTAPFISMRMLQRFGVSNPSPRLIKSVASAFANGRYYSASGSFFGSGEYGDMTATVAAILLNRESRTVVLDADPTHGSLHEPFLRLVRVMRSLQFQPAEDAPFVRFAVPLNDAIGQQSHKLPDVFSFFKPEYVPSGPIGNAHLYCPECMVQTGPRAVALMNGLNTMVKYGLRSDYGGFGFPETGPFVMGDYNASQGYLTHQPDPALNSAEVVDELATLLTAGRLDIAKRSKLVELYDAAVSRLEGFLSIIQIMMITPEFHTTGLSQNTGGVMPPAAPVVPNTKPYKAVIYLMLEGGMDSYNLLVPQVCSGTNAAGMTVDQQYQQERGELALEEDARGVTIEAQGQPCSTFALHDELTFFKELYDSGDLLFLANTGTVDESDITKDNYLEKTRFQLFAHNHMQVEVKTIDPKVTDRGTGVLGRMASILTDKGYATGSTSIDDASVTVQAAQLRPPMQQIVSRMGVATFDDKPETETIDMKQFAEEVNAQAAASDSLFGQTWSSQIVNGIRDADLLKTHLETTQLGDHWPTEPWILADFGYHFSTLARLIEARTQRGVERDVFYMESLAWDHHTGLKADLRRKFGYMNEGLGWLVQELKDQGVWQDVTIVIASEFGRTLTPNSGQGSDHGWGGHYVMMGGDVQGGRIVGEYPSDLTDTGPLNIGRGRIMPTMSWDAVWNGVAQWMGITEESELDAILPNRNNSTGGPFMDLMNEADLFKAR